MKRIARLLALLSCLTFIAAPISAAASADVELGGDITIVDGNSLSEAIGRAIGEASDELSDGDATGILQAPGFITALFALLNAVLVFLTTNGIKLSTMWVRGRKTVLLAALLSALTSGAGVFFGPAAAMDIGMRVTLAAAAALGTLGGAVGIQETRRQGQTGQRKPERKAGKVVADTVLEGLVMAAKVLPPPFNLGEPLIRSMYQTHGARVVKDLIDRQRALSQAEIEADQDRYKAENPLTDAELADADTKLRLRRESKITTAPAD